jgi:hypothetical protein
MTCTHDNLGPLTRRVGWTLSLVSSDWGPADGGTLDLMPPSGEAGSTARLLPQWNELTLYEVTPESFYKVSEVFSGKTRLTISGWYHCPGAPNAPPAAAGTQVAANDLAEYLPGGDGGATTAAAKAAKAAKATKATKATAGTPPQPPPQWADSALLRAWIRPTYLDPAHVAALRAHFFSVGSVELRRVLLPERFRAVRGGMAGGQWGRRGPPLRQWFSVWGDGGSGAEGATD